MEKRFTLGTNLYQDPKRRAWNAVRLLLESGSSGEASRVPIIISQGVCCRPLSSAPPSVPATFVPKAPFYCRGRNCLRRPICGPDDNDSVERSAHGQGRKDDHCLINMFSVVNVIGATVGVRILGAWAKNTNFKIDDFPEM